MNTKRVISLLMGLGVFILINAPSIKIIYSSEVINILGFVLVLIAVLLRGINNKIIINKYILFSLSQLSLLFLFLFYSIFFKNGQKVTYTSFLQYIIIFIISILLLCFFQSSDQKTYVSFQILWSVYIGIAQLMNGIELNSSLGQHYLTLGLPLGIGFVILTGKTLKYFEQKNNKKYFMLFLTIILLISMLTLRGRSPVIFSILTVYIFFLVHLFTTTNRLKNIFLLLTSTFLILYIFNNFASEIWIDRFFELTNNISDEPRVMIYQNTITAIKNNIFGYGLNSYSAVMGSNYPHNIFLEIFFYGGIFAIIAFLIYLSSYFKTIIEAIINTNYDLIVIGMASIYILLIWNVSYNLSSSYVLFASIAIVISSKNTYKKNKRREDRFD